MSLQNYSRTPSKAAAARLLADEAAYRYRLMVAALLPAAAILLASSVIMTRLLAA